MLRFYRDFMAQAPDEVGGGLALITAPPEEFVPEAARGKPAVGVDRPATSATARGRRGGRCGRCASSAARS